jgi:hypothetical protein
MWKIGVYRVLVIYVYYIYSNTISYFSKKNDIDIYFQSLMA